MSFNRDLFIRKQDAKSRIRQKTSFTQTSFGRPLLRGCEAIRVIHWDEFLFLFFFVMVVANCNASCYWLHVHCSQWQLLLFFPSGIKIVFVAIWRVSCGELGYCLTRCTTLYLLRNVSIFWPHTFGLILWPLVNKSKTAEQKKTHLIIQRRRNMQKYWSFS